MQLSLRKHSWRDYFTWLRDKNGPDHDDFDTVLQVIEDVHPEEVSIFRDLMQPMLQPETIIGFSYTKPMGYNGDYLIIEKIYQNYVNNDLRYLKWDKFFHRLPAAKAVVNRKKLAIDVLTHLNNNSNGNEKRVLVLGSGPVTEINEFLTSAEKNHLKFDLIDMDQRAIDYASHKNKDFLKCMHFHHKNVIRFTPHCQYDLIWSAGLFDYLQDKHFVVLLKRYYDIIAPGGTMIIGNFCLENPSRKIMEILGDWFLYHRSPDELVCFAEKAGIPTKNIEIISEPLGINIFLSITKH